MFNFKKNKEKEMPNTEQLNEQTEKVEETATETPKEEVVATETQNAETQTEQTKDETQQSVEQGQEGEGEQGNGIPLSEVVLKQDLSKMVNDLVSERFNAMQSKIESLLKQNEDLTNQLAKEKERADGLHDKYEVGNFGAPTKRGTALGGDKNGGNSSYVSYADMWNGATKFD